MKFSVLAAMLLLPAFAFGQAPVKKVREIDQYTREEYGVVAQDDSTREGEYKMYWRGEVEVKGQYRAGKKDGAWEFYSKSKELSQRYNFSTKKVEFEAHPEFIQDSKVILDGAVSSTKPDNPPAYIGGNSNALRFIAMTMHYTADALRNRVQGKVLVEGTVTRDGYLKDPVIVQGLGHGLDEETLRVVKLLPANWAPATVNGEAVEARLVFPVKYALK